MDKKKELNPILLLYDKNYVFADISLSFTNVNIHLRLLL